MGDFGLRGVIAWQAFFYGWQFVTTNNKNNITPAINKQFDNALIKRLIGCLFALCSVFGLRVVSLYLFIIFTA